MAEKSSGAFGDRMKSYERTTKHILSPRTFTIVRVDGRAFHTYLRYCLKPFDQWVIHAMDRTAVHLCNAMAGVRFAYTQSDEISILMTDLDPRTQPWFGGEIQKIASVAASIATGAFNEVYRTTQLPQYLPEGYATFDARVYTIPSRIEVANYFLWRQQDAIRNAVSMAAESFFPSRELHGVPTARRQEMLFQQHGVNFKTAYSDRERRGAVVVRETYSVETPVPVRKVGQQHRGKVVMGERRPLVAMRRRWATQDAPDFTLDNGGFLAKSIPQEPADALQPDTAPCPHESWEETPGGIPHRCNDCDHLFTQAEADERRGARR